MSLRLHSLRQLEKTSGQNPEERLSELEAAFQIIILLTDDYWLGAFNQEQEDWVQNH